MKKAIPPLMLAALSMAAIPGHAQENERLAVCELTRDMAKETNDFTQELMLILVRSLREDLSDSASNPYLVQIEEALKERRASFSAHVERFRELC